jgi:hypothetical protein
MANEEIEEAIPGEISKYKPRMNVDGSQMIKGLHYEETYAPVVQWETIRFFISLAILSNWHTRQLDFVLAYTQADIERDLYMKLPSGFTVPGRTITEQCFETGEEFIWTKASRKSMVFTSKEEPIEARL